MFNTIKDINITPIYAKDIDDFLNKNPTICKQYFRAESIIDIESFKTLLDERLNMYQKNINGSILREDVEAKLVDKGKKLIDIDNDSADFYKERLNFICKQLDSISKQSRECFFSILRYIKLHPSKRLRFDNIDYLTRCCEYENIYSLLEELEDIGFLKGLSHDDTPTEELEIKTNIETFEMLLDNCNDETLKQVIINKDFSFFE